MHTINYIKYIHQSNFTYQHYLLVEFITDDAYDHGHRISGILHATITGVLVVSMPHFGEVATAIYHSQSLSA